MTYRELVSDPTADLPVPADDTHLRVSDRERDDVIDLLAGAKTDGRLTLEEYSERSGRALTSVTRADLAPLTHDLATVAVTPARPVAGPMADEVERVVAIFGSKHRRGRWPVLARLEARAMFGECKLELQSANLHSRVTVLDVKATFGSVEIVVPPRVEVQMTGSSIFGSRSCEIDRDPPPGAPIVEVRGRAMFGEIRVRHPKAKEIALGTINQQLPR